MARVIRGVEAAWLALAVGFLVAMIVTVLCQVAFRYLFNLPLPWTEEISRLTLVGAVYAALPSAYLRGEHIAVDFFVGLLPPRILFAYILVLKAITFLVVAFFALGSFLQAQATWNMTFISVPALPVGVMYLIEGIALASFALLVVATWRDPDVYISTDGEEGDF